MLKKTKKEISFFYTKKELIIQDEDGFFTLFCSTEIFPEKNIDDFVNQFMLPGEILSKMIEETNISVKEEESGCMCFLLKEQSVSCLVNDRRRMSVSSSPQRNINTCSFFINPKIKKHLIKFVDDVHFAKKGNEFMIKTNNFFLVSKTYINTTIQPDGFLKNKNTSLSFGCNNQLLLAAVSRVLTIASFLTKSIKLTFSLNSLTIDSFDPTAGQCQVVVSGDGNINGAIFINGDYLLESLKCSTNEEVILFFQSPNQPIIIDNGGNHIIMPIPMR